jgi:hypothetical protein
MMLDRSHHWLTFANVTSVLALVFAMSGGAYAITSGRGPDEVVHGCYQKKRGALRIVPAGRKCAKSERGIAWNQHGVAGPIGLAGPAGQTGSPGAAGAPGVAGSARAYGFIEGAELKRSKNVVGITNSSPGIYCITLASGINAAASGVVVTLDHATDATEFGENKPLAFAEFRSDAADCPGGNNIDVITGARDVTTHADVDAGGTAVTKITNTSEDENFFFVVP